MTGMIQFLFQEIEKAIRSFGRRDLNIEQPIHSAKNPQIKPINIEPEISKLTLVIERYEKML